MATFADIAYMALRLSGQLMPGTTPSPEMMEDARKMCNSMIDAWNADRLKIYTLDDQVFNIIVAKQIYTLGTGGDYDPGYLPAAVVMANFLLYNSGLPVRVPIEVIVPQEWAAIPYLAVTTQVINKMWVQKTYPLINLRVFPIPTAGNQLELFMWKALTGFAASGTTFSFPQGYQDAITYNLAERMYALGTKQLNAGRQDRAILRADARRTLRVIEKFNAPFVRMELDYSSTNNSNGAPFNYLTGDFS